jgi:acetyl-CoA acetyltransferase
MNDAIAIIRECRAAQDAAEEISDGCARAIAAGYAEGMPSASFASTGAITDPDEVWRDLFYFRGQPMYPDMYPDEKIAADMLGTYLTKAGARGPVAGWSRVWVG